MFDCEAEWKTVARDVRGLSLDCGHFVAEEQPAQTLVAIQRFLSEVHG
jgi:haloacetate dehalogenase